MLNVTNVWSLDFTRRLSILTSFRLDCAGLPQVSTITKNKTTINLTQTSNHINFSVFPKGLHLKPPFMLDGALELNERIKLLHIQAKHLQSQQTNLMKILENSQLQMIWSK